MSSIDSLASKPHLPSAHPVSAQQSPEVAKLQAQVNKLQAQVLDLQTDAKVGGKPAHPTVLQTLRKPAVDVASAVEDGIPPKQSARDARREKFVMIAAGVTSAVVSGFALYAAFSALKNNAYSRTDRSREAVDARNHADNVFVLNFAGVASGLVPLVSALVGAGAGWAAEAAYTGFVGAPAEPEPEVAAGKKSE